MDLEQALAGHADELAGHAGRAQRLSKQQRGQESHGERLRVDDDAAQACGCALQALHQKALQQAGAREGPGGAAGFAKQLVSAPRPHWAGCRQQQPAGLSSTAPARGRRRRCSQAPRNRRSNAVS